MHDIVVFDWQCECYPLSHTIFSGLNQYFCFCSLCTFEASELFSSLFTVGYLFRSVIIDREDGYMPTPIVQCNSGTVLVLHQQL